MSNLENYMKQQAIFCEQNDSISKNLYSEYGVKRGLRDEKGQGVLTGLFFASTFWRKMQNIFGECCISKLEKVARPRLAAILPAT